MGVGKLESYLLFQRLAHTILLISFDDNVVIVKVLNDETLLLVHAQENLLDR